MAYSGSAGQYGLIPESVIRDKYEITNNHFDPETMENYYRETLKDVRPDEPFFESDQIRRDNHSEERLSIRLNGHRTGATPYHPDAFLELTERDPRGTSNDPNFRKSYEQSLARMKYVNFYPDGDPKTTERVKTDQEINRNKADTFYQVKDRMKWFATAKDNMASARNFRRFPVDSLMQDVDTDRVEKLTDDTGNYLEDASNWNKQDYTAKLSNSGGIGWEQTPDHIFNVAQYGAKRKQRNPANDVTTKILQEYHTEHDKNLTTFQDQVVSSGLAAHMANILEEQKIRYTYMDQDYPIHKQEMPNQYKQLYSKHGNLRLDSRLEAFKSRIIKENNKTSKFTNNVVEQKWQGDVTTKIAQLMESGIKKATITGNYRKAAQEQLMDWKLNKEHMDNTNIKHKSQSIHDKYNTDIDNKFYKGKTVKNYSNMNYKDDPNINKVNTEQYKQNSYERNNQEYKSQFIKHGENQSIETEGSYDYFDLPKGTGRSGSKRPSNDKLTNVENTISFGNDI